MGVDQWAYLVAGVEASVVEAALGSLPEGLTERDDEAHGLQHVRAATAYEPGPPENRFVGRVLARHDQHGDGFVQGPLSEEALAEALAAVEEALGELGVEATPSVFLVWEVP